MHHHVMAVEEGQVAIWRLGDVPDQPSQKDVTRGTQVACGAWVLSPDDERMPAVLRNCCDGVYVLGDGGSTSDDIAAVFSRWGLEVPGFVTIFDLEECIQQRLQEVSIAEEAAREDYLARLGKKASWRPIPWPSLPVDAEPLDEADPVSEVLHLVRQIERFFDAWDEVESQRLKRKWLTANDEIGGARRLQIKGTPTGWKIFTVESRNNQGTN
jgi:hypothetical protein